MTGDGGVSYIKCKSAVFVTVAMMLTILLYSGAFYINPQKISSLGRITLNTHMRFSLKSGEPAEGISESLKPEVTTSNTPSLHIKQPISISSNQIVFPSKPAYKDAQSTAGIPKDPKPESITSNLTSLHDNQPVTVSSNQIVFPSKPELPITRVKPYFKNPPLSETHAGVQPLPVSQVVDRVCSISVVVVITAKTWTITTVNMWLSNRFYLHRIPLLITGTTHQKTSLKSQGQVQISIIDINEANDNGMQKPYPIVYFLTQDEELKTIGKETLGDQNQAYLAALKLGACRIFEWDGMSHLFAAQKLTDKSLFELDDLAVLSLYSHGAVTMNPYGIFGTTVSGGRQDCVKPKYSSMYPRGTPKLDIATPVIPTLYATSALVSASDELQHFSTGIVQTLISRHPDFASNSGFSCQNDIQFKSRIEKASIYPSQFAALNNKATLTFEKALWSLFLPPSFPGKVGDIWRGYISQTLLRCTGQLITIHEPIVEALPPYQNLPSQDDNLDEQTNRFVNILYKFRCKMKSHKFSNSSLQVCMIQLYQQLYSNKLVSANDVKLLQYWLNQIELLGYHFPPYNSDLCSKPVKGQASGDSIFQLKPPLHPEKPLKLYNSEHTHDGKNLSDIVLVITINFKYIDVIPIWLSVYQYLVPPFVIFYAPGTQDCYSILTKNIICKSSYDVRGYFMYANLADAMERYPGRAMYIGLHDDVGFDPFMFHKFLESGEGAVVGHRKQDTQFCIGPDGKTIIQFGIPWPWSSWINQQITLMHAQGQMVPLIEKYSRYCPYEKKKHVKLKNTDQAPCFYGNGWIFDSYAVSAKHVPVFKDAMRTLRKYNIFLEVAVPWVLTCALGYGLKPTNSLILSYSTAEHSALWNINDVVNSALCTNLQKNAHKYRSSSNKVFQSEEVYHVAHPLKLMRKLKHLLPTLIARDCFLKPFT